MKRTSRYSRRHQWSAYPLRKRTSRRNPPPLYRAIGIDSSGRKVPMGAGPLASMRQSTMAKWLGDPDMKSAYVIDAAGHSYLSLEPKDRARLRANGMFTGAHSLFPGAQISAFGQRWVVHEVNVARRMIRLGRTTRGRGALLDVKSTGSLEPVDPASRKYLAWLATYAEKTDWWTLNAEAMPSNAYARNDVWPVAGDPSSVFVGFGPTKNIRKRTSVSAHRRPTKALGRRR